MKVYLYILTLALLLTNCMSEGDNDTLSFESIELIDNSTNTKEQLVVPTEIEQTAFFPMYIGKTTTPIFVEHKLERVLPEEDWNSKARSTYTATDLQIFVDTSRIIGTAKLYSIRYLIDNPKEEKKTIAEHLGYPVFLQNTSADSLLVIYGNFIPLVRQARDSTGRWRDLHSPPLYFCGTGLYKAALPPNELMLTTCALLKGNHTTTMRLSMFFFGEEIYSNEFEGEIDSTWLTKPASIRY